MKFITSLIVVKDIQKSRSLYEGLLGQTVLSDFGENVAYEGGFAIHQQDHFEKLIDGEKVTQKSNSCELYFEDDNLLTIVSKIEALRLEFLHKIREQPWKQLVVRFYDYDSNIIEIGETMEHTAYRLSLENYSVDEIAKTTYLAPEEIHKAIAKYSRANQ